jgi:membrane protease YdiL (CAAX protease family)
MKESEWKPLTARQSYNRMGLALFVMGVLSFGVQLLLSLLFHSLAAAYPQIAGSSWVRYILSFVPLYLVGMPCAYWLMKPVVISKPDSEPMLPGDFVISLLMCLPLMYLGSIIGNLLSALFTGGQSVNPLNDFTYDLSPMTVLVMVFIGPVLEEFFFRRQIIDRCGRFGEKQVILFSALAFGLFHMNLYQFFYAFFLGLVLGYVYTRSRRLRYTIAIHMIINLLGGILPQLLLTSIDEQTLLQLEHFTGSPAQMALLMRSLPALIAYGIFAIVMLVLTIIGIVYLFTKAPKFRLNPAPAQIPDGQARRTICGAPWVILFILFCVVMTVVSLVTSM